MLKTTHTFVWDDKTDEHCSRCGVTRIQVEDNLASVDCSVYPPTNTTEAAIGEAWLAFRDAVIAHWDAWSNHSAENQRLRFIAERLSGLPADTLNTICTGYPGQRPQIVGKHPAGDLHTVHGAPFTPAWANWLRLAQEALDAVDQADLRAALIKTIPGHEATPKWYLGEPDQRVIYVAEGQ